MKRVYSNLSAALFAGVMALFGGMLAYDSAFAHGPTRQKVTETVTINAPADKVWAVMGNFQDMSWHPAIASTKGEGGNDKDAKRTLTLKAGASSRKPL